VLGPRELLLPSRVYHVCSHGLRRGRTAGLLVASLRQGHPQAGHSMVPTRSAESDDLCCDAVAAVSQLPRLPDGLLQRLSCLLVRALQQRAQLSPRRLRRRVRQRRAQPSEAARVAGNPFVPGRHLRSIRAAAPRFKACDPQRQADRPQPSARILGARL